jgi:hypothetical protein
VAGKGGNEEATTGVRARDKPKIEKTRIGVGMRRLSQGGTNNNRQLARRLTRRKFCH